MTMVVKISHLQVHAGAILILLSAIHLLLPQEIKLHKQSDSLKTRKWQFPKNLSRILQRLCFLVTVK